MRMERRGCVSQSWRWVNLKGEEPIAEIKPFGWLMGAV
ncbi:protein of unknown function [uncultured Woeseiaceae bacterium]|uniref:Uncharacterized protein n=1 Tax=uncultured Woeseiaceae bacterium TaxID=1983305 RepID=A0A7D9D3M0_9GAMM|nr:protein of unknown function [uncultured Woeseiaceae bacterium]VUX56400.1 protein of unknown function [uncultured Woeseiaceae bacterium]VUX56404.1 protein of unknown function [uncultured Woeseiaceae bacterium]